MTDLNLNPSNTNQYVTISDLVEILLKEKSSRTITLLYRKNDDTASKKTPFGKICKIAVNINHFYNNKLINRIKDSEALVELKAIGDKPANYNYYNGSHCIAQSKKTNAFQLVYNYDRKTLNSFTKYFINDFEEPISRVEAIGRTTPSGLKIFLQSEPLSEKQTLLDGDKRFYWKSINLTNVIGLTINQTNYYIKN